MNFAQLIDVTLLFSGLFAILHVVFTLRVGLYRRAAQISLGHGDDKQLEKRVRGHGNFTENVPLALFLMLLNELTGTDPQWLMGIGCIFLIARMIHYVTIVSKALLFMLRPISMTLTLLSILTLGLLLLI